MKTKISNILTNLIKENTSKDEATNKLLALYNAEVLSFQKNRLDILNWAKSELKQETNAKPGKTMTPYRSDKVIFLRRVINWLNSEA